MGSLAQSPKLPYAPRGLPTNKLPRITANPGRTASSKFRFYRNPCIGGGENAHSLWRSFFLFQGHSETGASLNRPNCAMGVAEEIGAEALAQRASGLESVTKLALFASAFYQFQRIPDRMGGCPGSHSTTAETNAPKIVYRP